MRDFEEVVIKKDENIGLFKKDFEILGLEYEELNLSFIDVSFQMKELYDLFVVKEIEFNVLKVSIED